MMGDMIWSQAAAPAVPVSNEAEYVASMRLRRALRATATTAHDEAELSALEHAIEDYERRREPLTTTLDEFRFARMMQHGAASR